MAVKKGPNPFGKAGQAKSPDPTYMFGTPEEIANRTDTGYDRKPQDHAPSFRQIGPDNTGKNANNAGRMLRSGNFKFTRGPQ